MGFEAAKKWSQENGVNNTLVGEDPLAGQFNEYLSSETAVVTEADGGQVRNGNYALRWSLDNTEFTIKESQFTEELAEKGIISVKDQSGKRYYKGVKIAGTAMVYDKR